MRANRIKLLPERIAPWWQMLEAFLIARVPELGTVLSDDDAAWEHECKFWPEMIAANEWLATQLYTILPIPPNPRQNQNSAPREAEELTAPARQAPSGEGARRRGKRGPAATPRGSK